jgi:hypothetical protein
MPVLDDPSAVGSVRVWGCKYRTLAPLAALHRLRTLVILGFPDESLRFVGELQALRHLWINHLPKVSDLSPLQGLMHLETLELMTTPGWDAGNKKTKVTSLAPIASLPSLKHLCLFGVVPQDLSLRPLEQCKSLRSARFSKYPKHEMARFYEATGLSNAFPPKPVFDSD